MKPEAIMWPQQMLLNDLSSINHTDTFFFFCPCIPYTLRPSLRPLSIDLPAKILKTLLLYPILTIYPTEINFRFTCSYCQFGGLPPLPIFILLSLNISFRILFLSTLILHFPLVVRNYVSHAYITEGKFIFLIYSYSAF